jgi:hypothetical protein
LHPPQRDEHAYAGSLFHVDAKRFGRIHGIGPAAAFATRFFRRALRWFESLGVRCERVLTDNAKCYRWAYRYAYRTSATRAASLQPWVTHDD